MPIRVGVIGGGPAGLAAVRHLTARGDTFSCIAFEQTGSVGGTWVYTDAVGTDQFGLPIHTSLYKNLKTNLPCEVMSYPDFPLVADEDYVPKETVLQYLLDYTKHFNLEPHVKLYHHVTNVKSKDNIWEMTVTDLKTKEEKLYEFDAVMVCNGHYSKPRIPKLPGVESFTGKQVHSHDYRIPDNFRDRTVVVIGAGFSAKDMAVDISSVAKQVILSHHMKEPLCAKNFRDNIIQKPDIKSLTENTAIFEDDTICEIDDILYCTGYLFDFPFLDESCRFKVDDNFVQPLYKHMFHIDHPTLCAICLPMYVTPFGLSDIQVRYFLNTLDGSVALPSREDMVADTQREMEWRRSLPCFVNRKAHKMGSLQEAYCNDIAKAAGEESLPPIVFKRFNQSVCGASYL